MPNPDDNIFEKGPCGTIEFAIRLDRSRPAKDDLEKLSEHKKDRRKYSNLKLVMKQFVLAGDLPPSKMDRYRNTKLRKFKPKESYPLRIPFFTVGNRHFLTHVFEKKGDAYNQKQIKKAKQIRKEHYQVMGWSDDI
jgi:hypothetical protein